MDDLEAVLDDPHGHQLLAVVAAVHHQRVHQALDDRAVGLKGGGIFQLVLSNLVPNLGN